LQFNVLPDFYSDFLKYWQNTRSTFQKDTSPRKEIIWNNHNIIIDGKAHFYKSWLEKKNILRVEDLLDNNSNFFPFNLFSEKFHLETPFTLYFGLIDSVLAPWKLAMKRTPSHVVENENRTTKISTKSVYSIMLKKSSYPQPPRAKLLHMVLLKIIFRVYKLPFQIKSDIKATMFQYKIIHDVLPTKVSLFKAKICDDDICPQCLADGHSLDHMFLCCQ